MTTVNELTSIALQEYLKQVRESGYYDRDLESFGYFLKNYVIKGGEVSITDKQVSVTEMIACLDGTLYRVYTKAFTVTESDKVYYIDFTKTKGFTISETHPAESYLTVWKITTNANGQITTDDQRGVMGGVRFADEIAGIIIDSIAVDESNILDDSVSHRKIKGTIEESKLDLEYPSADLNNRISNIVANAGNSNSEIVDARLSGSNSTTYPTLKDRLDDEYRDIEAQFSDVATFSLDADIQGTTYTAGKKVDVELLRTKQAKLYGELIRRLRNKEGAIIACLGDSLTYGIDTTSADKRTKDTTVNADGVVYQDYHTRASMTYPEALSQSLNQLYGTGKISVINRGYSGDTAQLAYGRWNAKVNAHATIIMLGTNDAGSFTIDSFLNWYEKIIVKNMLQDSAVIILLPPKSQNTRGHKVNSYGVAIQALAKKYNIPVMDTTEMLANYGDIYSDGTHFNGKGYSIIGAKVASAFIGKGVHNPTIVSGGSKILTRPEIDGVYTSDYSGLASAPAAPTPAEATSNQQTVMYLTAGQKIAWSFYTDTDDILVIPYIKIKPGLNVKWQLDFGVAQPDFTLDGALDKASAITYSENGNLNYTSTGWNDITRQNTIYDTTLSMFRFHIVKKGWHTLYLESVNDQTIVYGLEFMSYSEVNNYLEHVRLNSRFYKGKLYDVYSATPASVTSTTIAIADITKAIGFIPIPNASNGYFQDVVLKLTLYNGGNSIKTYYFTLGNGSGGSFLIEKENIPTVANPPTARSITSIAYDVTNQQLTVNWGGATNMLSNFVITIA